MAAEWMDYKMCQESIPYNKNMKLLEKVGRNLHNKQ